MNLLISFASLENIEGPLISTTKINNPNIIKGKSPPKPITYFLFFLINQKII